MYLEYSEIEMNYLKEKDEILGKYIDRVGVIKRAVSPEPFTALVQSVIGQQISTKAASTVCQRVHTLLTEVTPENILKADKTALQKCGMSVRKTEYIRGIAEAAIGEIDFSKLHLLSDSEIIKKLITLNGIGEWTVEMLLVFSLKRPDIVSYKDLAIRRGIMNLYGLTELPLSEFKVYKERYSPYGTVASLYLWAASVDTF